MRTENHAAGMASVLVPLKVVHEENALGGEDGTRQINTLCYSGAHSGLCLLHCIGFAQEEWKVYSVPT